MKQLSLAQKIKLLKKNQIFTLTTEATKEYPQSYQNQAGSLQILVKSVIKKEKSKQFGIIGSHFDTLLYSSLDELVYSIDWVSYLENRDFAK